MTGKGRDNGGRNHFCRDLPGGSWCEKVAAVMELGLEHMVRSEGGARGQMKRMEKASLNSCAPVPFPCAGRWPRTT